MKKPDNHTKISRKHFFRWSGVALLIPLIKLWSDTVKDSEALNLSEQEITIQSSLPEGIHLLGRVIVVKNGNDLKLFSSKCPHLGCRINKVEGDILVCPCHGSAFNDAGIPVKGPAIKPLEKIEYTIIRQEKSIILKFKM
nr:Rieske (2Fe-2S) protein [Bacteroidota bacterium]